MAKKHNWVLIVLGVVIVVVILGIAAVAGVGYYMYRQMEPSKITGVQAEQAFAEARAKFQGETPYLDFSDVEHAEGVVHREQEKAQPTPIKQLRLVAYDPRDEKTLVRMTFPMWLLKYGGDKPISFSGSGSGLEWDSGTKLRVTPNEIEKHGPGLIVDTVGRRGEKILVWAE
jgi:hypothetical protein